MNSQWLVAVLSEDTDLLKKVLADEAEFHAYEEACRRIGINAGIKRTRAECRRIIEKATRQWPVDLWEEPNDFKTR